MSVWLWDVPVLFLLGAVLARVYAKWLVVKHPDFFAHAGTIVIAVFWLNALFAAFGARPWFGAVHAVRPISRWLGLFLTLSYPLWFNFGAERIFALFGRRPTQGGFLWPFTVKDRTKPFQPPWNAGAGPDDK
jgi:hypothetical protein